MIPASSPEQLRALIEPVFLWYAGLAIGMDPQAGLGGKLLFAGEMDEDGCRLVRAANIAGAASLSATADAAMQRQAIREGVIDFLVTSLDEALRILKNEVRKRNAVAVGVALEPAAVSSEMRERGVLPDLIRPMLADDGLEFESQGARIVSPGGLPEGCEFRVFSNPSADFKAQALASIAESDHAVRRWLLLSSRYLGPRTRGSISLPCGGGLAAELSRF